MSDGSIRSEAILASAGFGKTYRLAHRYIKLLAAGSTPSQICALTFSRKAAGEIFDSIVGYLRKAAADREAAAATARDIDMPALGPAQFRGLLKDFVRNLHRNHIGTLDSFTVSVIRAFPLELGISAELQLMDNGGSAARVVRYDVLSRIFNRRHVSDQAQADFHEAFKQATFGREEKNLVENLDRFISQYWETFQVLPDPDAWGNAVRIWPRGSRWLEEVDRPQQAAAGLAELAAARDFPDRRIAPAMAETAEALGAYTTTSPWTKSLENSLVTALLAVPDLWTAETATVRYYKEFELTREELTLWRALLRNLVGTEIRKALQQTAGLAQVLAQYDRLYDPIRRSGRMTFADAQYLLTAANEQSGGALASRCADGQNRLYIDYRLDCALDHWLIDEFQDTSDLQWEVVRNLIDEVMQDASGERSFFYVGDVKQAIHGWRGGNAALFGVIRRHYGIELQMADRSHRSCRAVLDTVNRVFGALPDTVSEEVREAWLPIWVKHVPEDAHVPATGYTGLVTAVPTGDKGKCLSEDRYHAVARILQDVDPVRRGLSTAVLVRTNDAGRALVDQLRRECPGIPVCHEGRARIADNPVVGALLALVRTAAHPGDTFAWRHVQMSPLGRYLADQHLERRDLPLKLLREIYVDGFEVFVRRWGSRLGLRPGDRFGLKRLEDLAAAAAAFDESASRDCGAFLHYVTEHEVEESGTHQTVRVMTIHKSKGLTFDLVVLPELERAGGGKVDLTVPRDANTNRPLWALKLPRKLVTECDPVLNAVRTRSLQADEFESLCVLYVGMTRARYATYMIVAPKSAPSSAADMLRRRLAEGDEEREPGGIVLDGETFACLHESGERDWYREIEPSREEEMRPCPELPADFAKRPSRRRRLARVEPSTEQGHSQRASRLFLVKTREVMDFGSAIHELLAEVEWIEDADVEAIIRRWEPTSSYEMQVTQDVIKQFRECMTAETVRAQLARPAGPADPPWREKRFEIVRNGRELVTGAFDRVTVMRDEAGRPLSASILDYKSSVVDEPSEIDRKVADYVPQMTTYREALSQILGLDQARVSLYLLFTRHAVVREIGG